MKKNRSKRIIWILAVLSPVLGAAAYPFLPEQLCIRDSRYFIRASVVTEKSLEWITENSGWVALVWKRRFINFS